STRALFSDGGVGLYSAPLDGSSARVQLDSESLVTFAQISPDGARAVYPSHTGELRSVSVIGDQPPVTLAVAPSTELTNFIEVTPDSRRVLYVAGLTPSSSELYSVPIDGSASPVRVSGAMAADGGVGGDEAFLMPFALTADGATVVYIADQDTDDVFELYR